MPYKIFKILIILCAALASSSLFAQQGIGTEYPSKSAALDIVSNQRGLLIPRVNLVSINDDTTINEGNVESLLVYNTNSQNMVSGYYYWSVIGSVGKWKRLLVEGDGASGDNVSPWFGQETHLPATQNNQDIYQNGNVVIGKNEGFLGATLDVAGTIRGGNPADGVFGENSIAVGEGVIASGKNSMAIGYASEAIGVGSFAGGGDIGNPGGKASGISSFAFGEKVEAEGLQSFAFGEKAKASGNRSFAFGLATGSDNFTEAKGKFSFAFGNDVQADKDYSFAFGLRVKSFNKHEFVFGKDNALQNDPDSYFQIANGSEGQGKNLFTILKDGEVGIGLFGNGIVAKPTEMLDIGSGSPTNLNRLRIRDLPSTEGAISDKIVVVDGDGILKSIIADLGVGGSGILSAGNGLSLVEDGAKVVLGGTLEHNTEIILNNFPLKFTGLDDGKGTDDVLVVDSEGNLKKAKSMMPKFFHMPAVMMPWSEEDTTDNNYSDYNGGSYTVNLYQIYADQFGMLNTNSVSSETGHQIPVLPADELIYNITYYDDDFFVENNINVSTSGVLTYEIIPDAEPTAKTYMNIVFEVKD